MNKSKIHTKSLLKIAIITAIFIQYASPRTTFAQQDCGKYYEGCIECRTTNPKEGESICLKCSYGNPMSPTDEQRYYERDKSSFNSQHHFTHYECQSPSKLLGKLQFLGIRLLGIALLVTLFCCICKTRQKADSSSYNTRSSRYKSSLFSNKSTGKGKDKSKKGRAHRSSSISTASGTVPGYSPHVQVIVSGPTK